MISDRTQVFETLQSIFPFKLLEDEDLTSSSPFFEKLIFPAGAVIFSDGYPASHLYFVASGKVKLIHHGKKADKPLGVFRTGDHFGEEALNPGSHYQTKAICESDTTILRIKGSKAIILANSFPQLHTSFSLFKNTFHLASSVNFPWRAPSEGIELISRRHPIFLVLRLMFSGGITLTLFSFLLFSALASLEYFTPLLILSFLVLLVGGFLCAWSGLEWRNDFFILTQERVCVQKKLIGFYESRHESPVNAILSVGIDTSMMGRILGYGSVTVRTYTGDLQFKRLPFPHVIHELLEIRRKIAADESSQTEKREIREALTNQKEHGRDHKSRTASGKNNSVADQVYQSGSLSDLLAEFFRLRTVKEDSVIYRTHWWILFRKTVLPALFLLAVVMLILARLIGFLASIPETTVYVTGLVLSIIGWGWWLYQFQDWQNDLYIITDEQLIDVYKKPLGNEDSRSAPVKNIQTVEFERKGLINLILNFGTVKIKIGNEELSFNDVYQPSQVQSEIYTRYRAFQETAKKTEQQRFVEWIKTYDELKQENEIQNPSENPDEKG